MNRREEAMTKRARKVAVRTRQRNQKERAILDLTLQGFNLASERRQGYLTDEINRLKINLQQREMQDKPKPKAEKVDKSVYERPPTRECTFHTTDTFCDFFPCHLPRSYTSIQGEAFDRVKLRLDEPVPGPDENLPGMKPKETACQKRERALTFMIDDLRRKNVKNKPADRAVKYGAPMPRRKLMEPARPS